MSAWNVWLRAEWANQKKKMIEKTNGKANYDCIKLESLILFKLVNCYFAFLKCYQRDFARSLTKFQRKNHFYSLKLIECENKKRSYFIHRTKQEEKKRCWTKQKNRARKKIGAGIDS